MDNVRDYSDCDNYQFKIDFITPSEFNIYDENMGAILGWETHERNQWHKIQYADDSSFHHFSMKPIYTNLWAEFFQWQNGKETQLADGKNCANFADPQNMRLRVTASPSEINYYVDGRNVATCENKGAAGTRVGLRVSRAEALFDNLIIYEGVVEPAVGNEKGEIVLTPDPTIAMH